MKRKMKIATLLICCLLMPLVFCACKKEEETNGNIKVTNIAFSKNEITLVVDGDKSSEEEIEVSFEPENATENQIEFAQYNKELVNIKQKSSGQGNFVISANQFEGETKSTIIVVRMKGNLEVQDSLFVKVVKKSLEKLETPTNLTFNALQNRIEWDASSETVDEGFSGYKIDINGQEYISTIQNFWTDFEINQTLNVKVKALSSIHDFDSDYSETYTFKVLEGIQNLKHKDGVISWDAVEGAKGYEYKIDIKNPLLLSSTATSYNQQFDEEGEHVIEVSTIVEDEIGEDGTVKCHCFASNSASITVTKLSAPADLYYKNMLSWSNVVMPNGSMPLSYEVYEVLQDGTSKLIAQTRNISYALSKDLASGNHSFKVLAVGDGVETISSDFSAIKTVNKLQTPTGLRVEDGVITWDKDINAVTYQLCFQGYYDGVLYSKEFYTTSREENALFYIDQPDESVNKIVFKLGEKFKGDYKIKVASVSDALNTVSSDWTEEIFAQKLSSPNSATFGVQDNKVTWQVVENATSYEIIVNIDGNEIVDKVSTNSYTLPQESDSKMFSFKIRSLGNTATGDADKFINSDYSSLGYATKLQAPTLSVSNGCVVWNQIEYCSKYILNINGVDYDMGKQTSYAFVGDQAKDYNVKVKAIGGNGDNLGTTTLVGSFDSNYSASISVTKYQSPILYLDTGSVRYRFTDEANACNLTYQRNEDGTLSYIGYVPGDNEKYITSENSAQLVVWQAPSPSNLKVINGVLIWDALDAKYAGAHFEVITSMKNDEKEETSQAVDYSTNHSIDFSSDDYGEYIVDIRVVGTSGETGNLVLSSSSSKIAFAKLPKPEILITNGQTFINTMDLNNLPGIITWQKVSIGGFSAVGYNLKIEKSGVVQTYDMKTNTSYTLPNESGTYKISIEAYGDGQEILDSDYSEAISCQKLTPAKNVSIDNDGKITWSSDYNGSLLSLRVVYAVEINGEKYLPYDLSKLDGADAIALGNYLCNTKFVDFNNIIDGQNVVKFAQGDYNVRILTIPINVDFLDFSKVKTDLLADASELLTFNKLEQPYGLKVDRNENGNYIVNWTRSLNSRVSGYEILIKQTGADDESGTKVVVSGADVTSYDFTQNYLLANGLDVGSYIVKVKALTSSNNTIHSEYSQEVLLKVASKVNLSIKDGELNWTKVAGVTKYVFTFTREDGTIIVKEFNADTTSYQMSLTNDANFTSGKYNIKVQVIADETSNYGDVIYLDNYTSKDCGDFIKLETPSNLRVQNGLLNFYSKDTPESFKLFVSGDKTSNLTLDASQLSNNTYNFELPESFSAGNYSFRTQAIGGMNYLNSEVSEYINPQVVTKLGITSMYVKDGIISWSYVQNSNGFIAQISGANFYVYDEDNNEFTQESTGQAFDIRIESGLTALNISNELVSIDGRRFILDDGQYSIRIKAVGTDTTYLNGNFTSYNYFRKLKTIENLKINDGKLTWDKLASTDAPNGIALFIKFANSDNYEEPIILDGDANSFDFAQSKYYAQAGYSAYLQTIGDTNLAITNNSLGYICGTPSLVKTDIEKLIVPTNLKVSSKDSIPEVVTQPDDESIIGVFTFNKHPKFDDIDTEKYLLTISVISNSQETVLNDIILTENSYIISNDNLQNITLSEGLQIVFKVKYLGQDSYINSDYSESFTIIIPSTPTLEIVNDQKGRFTGKIVWNEVKVGDFSTTYGVTYQFISSETASNLNIQNKSDITEEIWKNESTVTEINIKDTYYYVSGKGYYRFKVISIIAIDENKASVSSLEKDYSECCEFNLFSSGNGTKENPFVVNTAETFNYIRYNLSAHYKLTMDIDFDNVTLYEIGSAEEKFTGTFDGDNKVLKNISILRVAENNSIFNYVGEGGVIKNIIIQNMIITNGTNVGGVVGLNEGKVSNIKVGAIMEDNKYVYDGTTSISPYSSTRYIVSVGGIVGKNLGTVVDCENYAVISARNDNAEVRSGGIVGHNEGTVHYCYNYNNVGGLDSTRANIYSNMSGGIVGLNNQGGIIDNCGNFGNVFAQARNENASSQGAYAGGIVAFNNRGTVTNCFNDNSNTKYSQDQISDATQILAITGFAQMDVFAGGIAGYNQNGSLIDTCYSLSNIQYNTNGTSADINVGSLVGRNDAVSMLIGKTGLRSYALYSSTVVSSGETFIEGSNVYVNAATEFEAFARTVQEVFAITTLCEVKFLGEN